MTFFLFTYIFHLRVFQYENHLQVNKIYTIVSEQKQSMQLFPCSYHYGLKKHLPTDIVPEVQEQKN